MNPSAAPTTAAPARPAASRTAPRLSATVPSGSCSLLLAVGLVLVELRTSRLQAALASRFAREISFRLEAGKSPAIRFPVSGPHDERLGYTALPGFISRLEAAGFEVKFQARSSPRLLELMRWGLPAIYHEKLRAGLAIEDHTGRSLAHGRFPDAVYRDFASIPPLVVADAALHREPRAARARLAATQPGDRMGPPRARDPHAALAAGAAARACRAAARSRRSSRSTCTRRAATPRAAATSCARSAPRRCAPTSTGRTRRRARRRIVLDYLNSVPLAARAGFGELRGLGDALWAWHGADFAEVNAAALGSARHAADSPGARAPTARCSR